MPAVLIVDDDDEILEALSELVASEGYLVRVAHDGVEGLERLASEPVDVILLDVEMPRLGGPEMAYEIFLRDAGMERIPIVLLSGRLGLSGVARRVGTPYFLAKPYTAEELFVVIDQALAEKTPPRPTFPGLHAPHGT